MKINTINAVVGVINILFLVALIYGVYYGQFHSYGATMEFFTGFLLATFFAAASIWFHITEQLTIDRFMLATYLYVIIWDICFIMTGLLHLFLMILSSRETSVFIIESIELDNNAPGLFYIILIAVGIYTTFYTRAGFAGVIGKNSQATEKMSRILLAITIIIGLIALFWVDKRKALFVGSIIFGIIYMCAKQQALYMQRNV